MSPRVLAFLFAGLAAAVQPALAQLRPTLPLASSPLPSRPAGPRQADYIVAVVNSEPITNNEVRTRLLRFEQQLAQQGAAMPTRAELTRVVLERLISEKAQLQLAREQNLKASDAQVDQAEQNFARQNDMDVAALRRRLAATGVDSSAFREDLRNQILLSRLRDREVEQRVKVTDLDVEQFMREQAVESGPTELNLAHILVALPENATEAQVRAAQEKAQKVAERARGGEDFAKLARENSDAPGAAASGGQMGMRPEDRYPGLFVDAVQSLPVGGISQVVRSGAGFHVLKVLEKRRGGLATAVTQTHARHILLRTSASLTEQAAVARLADYKRRIQSGQATFEQLAKEFSQDASAQRGGDLGWTNPGTFVPEFEEALDALSPGQIADPLVSRFGVHLVQVLERRTAELSPREQRDIARNVLREKKLDEAYAQWAQEVRGRAYVEFREPPQ